MGTVTAKLRDHRARLYTKYFAPVIFVHINKTGGSSIERALNLPFQHRTAVELKELLGERRWRRRFSFAVIRNPWDKVASHYHYRVKTNQTGLRDRRTPFSEWVKLTYGEQDPRYYDNPRMFMPQMDWLVDGQGTVLVNYVGRFENLNEDFSYVCRQIGSAARLPHLKQSDRGDYRKYYNDESALIVERWFERDIHMFGYCY